MPRPPLLSVPVVLLAGAVAAAADPDPAAVRRYGPGYRYPQAGWTVVHVEGEPFARGYQHGRLLAREIGEYVACLARQQSPKAPADGWRLTRTLVGAAFLRKFDPEYLEEMKGIADGAAAGGAQFDGRPVDLVDVAAANVQMEYETLDAALAARPTGLEGLKFPAPPAARGPDPAQKDHCSAFAATGPATRDGKLVVGHITMSGLANALGTNVWLDVQPAKGHRVVMQGFPGAIWSAQDYYLNSAGIVLTETTIKQTRFDPDGVPLATRCRRAMQYGATIDDVVKTLLDKNNGLYTNEWLLGDANTNEVAMLELGTSAHRLRRSSRNEWLLPGAEGFYWGCNNTKDLRVRLDTFPGLLDRPRDVSWVPADRDKAWLRLYTAHRGKVDAEFGRLAFATPPLAARPSLDAKVTTADMAKRLESHALFGPPYGKVWAPTPGDRADHPDITALVPNDWTVLTSSKPQGPKLQGEPRTADLARDTGADLSDPAAASVWRPEAPDPLTAPAWHGTLLPKADADVWVTAGFAGAERVAALETALREKAGGRLPAAARDRVGLALFKHRTDYLSAVAGRPRWRAPGAEPADPIAVELDRDRWHREEAARGTLALLALRDRVGADKFAAGMDAVGRAHAGKEVAAADFAAEAGRLLGLDATGFLKAWDPAKEITGAAFSTARWLDDLGNAVIVYGTAADVAANKAAADALQEAVRFKWANVTVPVRPDTAADADLTGRHVVLIGRPATNRVTARWAGAFPVRFGPASATVAGNLYGHEGTAVVAAGTSPADRAYSAVVVAGLSADSTYRAAADLVSKGLPAAEAVVLPAAGGARPVVATRPAPTDKAAAAQE